MQNEARGGGLYQMLDGMQGHTRCGLRFEREQGFIHLSIEKRALVNPDVQVLRQRPA